MAEIAFALVVATAAIHAFWNALLKQGSEGDSALILVLAGHVAVGLAAVAILGAPNAASLPYLAVSTVLQAIAWLAVSEGYRHGEFGAVYPLARATGPVGIALLAAVLVPEWPSPGVAIGIAGVVAGILVLQFSGPVAVPRRVLAAVLIFGACNIACSVADGSGARLNANPFSYIGAVFATGSSLTLVVLGGLGRLKRPRTPRAFRRGLVAAALAPIPYGTGVWAMTVAPMGAVSALRETSVMFALLYGALIFGEKLTPRRIAGALCIAGGAAVIGLAR